MRVFMFLLVFVLTFSSNAFCTYPESIYIIIQEGSVELVISHTVEDPTEHYVNKLEVSVNEKVVEERSFTSQTDEKSQHVLLEFLATRKGDVLEVIAYCNKYGRFKKKITVE